MLQERILFSTYIFYSQLNLNNLTEIIQKVKHIETVYPSAQLSNKGGWQSPMFEVVEEPFINIFNNLNLLISELSTQYGTSKKLKLQQYWFNINRQKHYNSPHTHQDEIFSGVLYLKVPKNSGVIRFHNPLEGIKLEINKPSKYTFNACEFEPNVGDVFLFQSTVMHSVGINDSLEHDDERISIAFDYR